MTYLRLCLHLYLPSAAQGFRDASRSPTLLCVRLTVVGSPCLPTSLFVVCVLHLWPSFSTFSLPLHLSLIICSISGPKFSLNVLLCRFFVVRYICTYSLECFVHIWAYELNWVLRVSPLWLPLVCILGLICIILCWCLSVYTYTSAPSVVTGPFLLHFTYTSKHICSCFCFNDSLFTSYSFEYFVQLSLTYFTGPEPPFILHLAFTTKHFHVALRIPAIVWVFLSLFRVHTDSFFRFFLFCISSPFRHSALAYV